MKRFKQIIFLSDKVSSSIFDLPCIRAIEKSCFDNKPVYRFNDVIRSLRGVVAHSLRPGEIIGEDQKGKWWWLTQKDYDELKASLNI